MDLSRWRRLLAWLGALGALTCGIIGLVAGFAGKEWQRGATGWFTGGTVAALLAVFLLLDEYADFRRSQ